MASKKANSKNKSLFERSEEKIVSLFSKNSLIHTLTDCDEDLSLLDRLRLFGFSDFRLERLLDVESVSDQRLFNTDEINYLERMNLQLDIPRVYFLTEKSDRNVMEKFITLGYYEEISQRYYTAETMRIAASLGKIKAVTFLHERKCPWNEWIPMFAAKNDHLHCLEYVHTHGCPWDEYTPMYAAERGHLPCLEYAHSHGCPWNELTPEHAARNGHFDILKYAHLNGCPWGKTVPSNAARGGHLSCLKYAHENKCPWDEGTTRCAAENGHLSCLKYAYENGCPYDKWTFEYAAENCLEYARENGCI